MVRGASVFSVQTWVFSPPAWGWSGDRDLAAPDREVLPTRVGMVRRSTRDRMTTQLVLPTRVGMVRPASTRCR